VKAAHQQAAMAKSNNISSGIETWLVK